MKRDQLNEFYSMPSCEEQEQADCFITQAINLEKDGDAIIAAEMLNKAHQIITDKLESKKQCNCSCNELIPFVADVEDLSAGHGGLYN